MHIPDYYLGESTIRAFWILMLIVWIYALNQLRSLKRKRLLLVAICAALAFFITMFNVPISGGIHGLVVGGTMIALMIGPWAAVIAISLALGLQALILGYGGIWTYAANCFFMAFLTPFIGYHCYLYLSGESDIKSIRRIMAVALASWLALTASATFVGIVLGLQPILYADGNGMPLHFPYSLSVTVPAMFLQYASIFGIVEAVLSALIFIYIRKKDASLFFRPQGDARGDWKH
mgnify:CR=1 FL=1